MNSICVFIPFEYELRDKFRSKSWAWIIDNCLEMRMYLWRMCRFIRNFLSYEVVTATSNIWSSRFPSSLCIVSKIFIVHTSLHFTTQKWIPIIAQNLQAFQDLCSEGYKGVIAVFLSGPFFAQWRFDANMETFSWCGGGASGVAPPTTTY